jgi:hypothetical protein
MTAGPARKLLASFTCAACEELASFGYKDKSEKMVWYCGAHRLAKWWADARCDGSAHSPAWMAEQTWPEVSASEPRSHGPSRSDPIPPDLQALVAQFGRFDLITLDAWSEFDAAIAKWRVERLAAIGIKPISPQQAKARKRAKSAAKVTTARPPGAGRAVKNANAPKIEEETMMDMGKYAGSAFLKAEHLVNGPRSETIAKVRDGSFDRPELVFEDGDVLSLNVTNTRVLCRNFGPNSDDWIGKSIELSAGEIEFKGEKRASILVKPLSPAVPKSKQQPLPPEPEPSLSDEMADEIPF